MEEQQVRELFFERLEHLSAEAEYELRHPDYVMEMPQSGERIRGRDAMRAFQEAYPNPPTTGGNASGAAHPLGAVVAEADRDRELVGAADDAQGQALVVADLVEHLVEL